jgi:hypothetical protein
MARGAITLRRQPRIESCLCVNLSRSFHMAIATFFSVPHFLAPLQAFVHWLAGGAPATAATAAPVRVAYPAPATVMPAAPAKPLRVVRVLEPSASRTVAGRMVISGRLADVCAELDRLAALER